MPKTSDNKVLFWGRQRIGDVVMSIPALKILRQYSPTSYVRYVTTFYSKELIELSGLVDDVRCYHLKGGLWDFFRWFRLRREVKAGTYEHIFLTGKVSKYSRKIGDPEEATNIRNVQDGHVAEKCAYTVMKGLGIEKTSIPGPDIELPHDPTVTEKLRSLGIKESEPYLTVHAGCNRIVRGKGGKRGSEKLWPAAKYAPLFDLLHKHFPELKIVLVGTSKERDWIQTHIVNPLPENIKVLNLVGHTSIRDTLQLLDDAKGLLCGDSGVMHLATMVKTPTVALFGPTNENETGPFGAHPKSVKLRAVPHSEAVDDDSCMDDIGVQDVFEGITNCID